MHLVGVMIAWWSTWRTREWFDFSMVKPDATILFYMPCTFSILNLCNWVKSISLFFEWTALFLFVYVVFLILFPQNLYFSHRKRLALLEVEQAAWVMKTDFSIFIAYWYSQPFAVCMALWSVHMLGCSHTCPGVHRAPGCACFRQPVCEWKCEVDFDWAGMYLFIVLVPNVDSRKSGTRDRQARQMDSRFLH